MPVARHPMRWVVALWLVLASFSAMALGLGEIRVKSQPGQPLVAEIPVISNEPGELEQLQARLASPVTFERVGLPRPQGLVNDLSFAVALDDSGRPVIRVTSQAPVDVAAVNFLIEVDWGQGRLVREYSALVQAPGTVAAADQPYIQAPQAAPSDTIVREPQMPASSPPASSEPLAAEPEATPAEPTADTAIAPAPVPAPQAIAAAPSAAMAAPMQDTVVQRGQTLSEIASRLRAGTGYTLDQTMVALLRANPEAFIKGNINLLKQGAVLRVPPSADIAQLQEAEAAALVRSQIAEWRQARQPIPQPVANNSSSLTATGAAPANNNARLEIAPPVSDNAGQAGTQSGISSGGEGDMLAEQQLQQSQEDLAARETEVQELRAQVAELEKLKQQQAKLIAMKDSDLAAAQQQLAQSNGSGGLPLWAGAGLLLLLAAAVIWGFSHRRRRLAIDAPAKPVRAPRFDSAALAAAVPVTEPEAQPLASDDVATAAEPVDDIVAEPAGSPMLEPAVGKPVTTFSHSASIQPPWHSGPTAVEAAKAANAAVASSPSSTQPAGRDRLELAMAYLDLGDVATARDLLHEVLDSDDDVARGEARQLLREIG